MGFIPIEAHLRKVGYLSIAGLDEAGRGPWAGPVVCAAVILKKRARLPGIRDSKLLSRKMREKYSERIKRNAWYGIGMAEAREIDIFGLIPACEKAFRRALRKLAISKKPDFLLIDGQDRLRFSYPCKFLVKGDRKVKSIAAASILAKVTRDRMMDHYAHKFPLYRFDSHKGYGTQLHQNLLKLFGPCPIHRRTFEPVRIKL